MKKNSQYVWLYWKEEGYSDDERNDDTTKYSDYSTYWYSNTKWYREKKVVIYSILLFLDEMMKKMTNEKKVNEEEILIFWSIFYSKYINTNSMIYIAKWREVIWRKRWYILEIPMRESDINGNRRNMMKNSDDLMKCNREINEENEEWRSWKGKMKESEIEGVENDEKVFYMKRKIHVNLWWPVYSWNNDILICRR